MFSGQFYGLKSASELKSDDTLVTYNRLGFPKMPFKSRLSFSIIEIIALKDKRFTAKMTKVLITKYPEPEIPCTWEAPNIFIFNENVA